MADPIEPDQNATSAGVTSIPEMIGKGAPSGVCDLDAAAVVPMSRIPMAVGGTGGLTSTPTQIVAHSMTGTAGGLAGVYPSVWEQASDPNYYTGSFGVRRDSSYTGYTADYYLHTTALSQTQWAEVEVSPESACGYDDMHGVVLRAGNETGPSTRNGLLVVVANDYGSNGFVSIARFTSRVSNITWLREVRMSAPIAPGDVIRALVDGDTITVSVNGAEVVAYSGAQVSAQTGSRVGVYAGNGGRIKNFKAGTVSTPMRVNQPLCVHLASTYSNPANTDLIAGGNWSQVTGPSGVYLPGGTSGLGGNTAYARCVIPATAWYRVELTVQSTATTGTAGIKIMKRTGTAAPVVTTHSIASALGNAGGEGTPLYACSQPEIFAAGDVIYWATWASVATTFQPQAFGQIKSKFTLTRVAS
ncbi:hypothetical protein ACFQNE_02125 [Gordonia phosphorivorans]|uniref:Minor tail protein n=2 Tax=Gordonia TaxID=2053 RepID=A0ABP8ZLF1_9ACTN